MSLRWLFTLALLIPALATAGEDKTLQGSFKVGYTQTTGNSRTKTLSLAFELDVKGRNYENVSSGRVIYGESRGKKVLERINLKNRTKREAKGFFYFWDIAFHRDPFRRYNQRYAMGPGVGKEWKKGDRLALSTTLSIYYYYENLAKKEPDKRRYFMYSLGQKLSYRPFTTLKLSEELSFSLSDRESGDYFVNLSLRATNRISERISLEVSYRISYQNKPVRSGVKKTDTFLITSVVFRF